MGKLSQAELDALPAKTKKNPDVVRMYLENDFLTAYAMHTDFRVGLDPTGAIGASHDWDRHGSVQLEFLKSQGLQPANSLLDLGCGTGRLARKVVPYLDPQRYFGYDISSSAIEAAYNIAVDEGWMGRSPHFSDADDFTVEPKFDYVWAFSVFIHLPDEECDKLMRRVSKWLAPAGKFFFSYVPEKIETRTGLKQFRHTLDCYRRMCEAAGLSFEDVPQWNAEQRVALAKHL